MTTAKHGSARPGETHQKQDEKDRPDREAHPTQILQRMTLTPLSITPADIQRLQRTIGNQATIRTLAANGMLPPSRTVAPSTAQVTPTPAAATVSVSASASTDQPTLQRELDDNLLGGLAKQRQAATGMSEEEAMEEEGGAGSMLAERQRQRLNNHLLRGLARQRQAATGMSEEETLEEEGGALDTLEMQQHNDPRYQNAKSQVATDTVTTGMPQERSERRHRQVQNRRARQLGPVVKQQRERQIDEEMTEKEVAERQKELTGLGGGRSMTDRGSDLSAAMSQDETNRKQREQADADAKPLVDAKMAAIDQRSAAVLKLNYRINMDSLSALIADKKKRVAQKRWALVSDLLDEINNESAKLGSYLNELDSTQERISALGKNPKFGKKAYDLRQTFFVPFETAIRNRNDVAATAALTALKNELQSQEDKLAADQAAVQERQRLRANGLWPANNRPTAQIAEATRATLGSSAEERAAVVESLDALKNGTAHGWARKWGAYHGNGEGNLPGAAPGLGGYKEYYVRPDGNRVGVAGLEPPGARRIVVSDSTGFVYYSHNHYGDPNGTTLPAFVKVTDA
jgi:flagellin-like hook-associated protein FlgL